jgi:hypothetical protein
MTILEYLAACAGLTSIPVAIVAAYKVGRFIAQREPIQEIDMDLFEAEMAMEAAVLEYRLADERRLEMAARFQ